MQKNNLDALYFLCSTRFKCFTIYAHNRSLKDSSWKYPSWLSEAFYGLLTFIGCKY